jgi:hypothetical protein
MVLPEALGWPRGRLGRGGLPLQKHPTSEFSRSPFPTFGFISESAHALPMIGHFFVLFLGVAIREITESMVRFAWCVHRVPRSSFPPFFAAQKS